MLDTGPQHLSKVARRVAINEKDPAGAHTPGRNGV